MLSYSCSCHERLKTIFFYHVEKKKFKDEPITGVVAQRKQSRMTSGQKSLSGQKDHDI
jgi:hypothetical protein